MLLNDFLFFLCIAPCLPQEEAILSRWELNVENEINVLNLTIRICELLPAKRDVV
jgi:hypothetical protein